MPHVYCEEPEHFPPGHWLEFTQLSQKRARVQYWSVFLSRISIRRESSDYSMTDLLWVASQTTNCLTPNCMFFSAKFISEERTLTESPTARKRIYCHLLHEDRGLVMSCLVASMRQTDKLRSSLTHLGVLPSSFCYWESYLL